MVCSLQARMYLYSTKFKTQSRAKLVQKKLYFEPINKNQNWNLWNYNIREYINGAI